MDRVIIGIAETNALYEARIYYLWECPKLIEDEVWGNRIYIGDPERVKKFDFTWLKKLQEVCEKHNVEIKLHQ